MPTERKRPTTQSRFLTSWTEQREEFVEFYFVPFHLIRDSLQHNKHGVVFGQDAANREACVGIQRLQLAQQQKSEDVIDVGIEKDRSRDGRMPSIVIRGMRMEFRSGFDLLAEVGGSPEKKPVFCVGTDGELGLRPAFPLEHSGAKRTTVRTGAIPLREPATGSRA